MRFATIEGVFAPGELAMLIIAKTLLAVLCIACGFAGGVFSPSFLIGLLLGALGWMSLEVVGIPNSGVAPYAIGGMMALASPVVGAPLSMILIVFELTRNYDLTIVAMVAVVFSNLLAYRLFGRSLFDVQLERRGVNLRLGRDRAQLEHEAVVDHLTEAFVAIRLDDYVEDAVRRLRAAGRNEGFAVDDENRYMGIVRLLDLIDDTQPLIEPSPVSGGLWFDETTSLWQAMRALDGFIGESIPVIDSESRRLVGVVSEGDIVTAYFQCVHGLRREENAAL